MESVSVHHRNGTFRAISVNVMTETVTNMMVSFAQVQYGLTLNCSKKQTALMEIVRQSPSSFSTDGGSAFVGYSNTL